jgi:hypothetical protein
MAIIPAEDNLKYKLNNTLCKKELPRPYLGLSMIGEKCHRYLQYYHYWAYEIQITRRIRRLFDDGHKAENTIIQELAINEIIVTGMQAEVIGTAGHWKGHSDGRAFHIDDNLDQFLVEFKTHNDKNYCDLVKNGVRKAFPKHHSQATSYMGYEKLPKTLYVGYNKDTSEMHPEWFDFDQDHFNELKRKEIEVIASDELLPRIGNGSSAWFECKFCDARKVCYGKQKPAQNCRTCEHVDILDKGVWACSLDNETLTLREQKAGCDAYKLDKKFTQYD